MNEQLLLGHIRALGPCSRAELARLSGLSKPTVSLALADRGAGRAGPGGRAADRACPAAPPALYEVRPDAGYVLGLDIGHKYVRGALADLAGGVLARAAARSRASSVRGRVGELIRLADELCAEAGVARSAVTQTVIGSPGVYDPRRNSMALTGGLPGWNRPAVLADLRAAFGQSLVVENDVDAAALAERAHGHGREADSFAFVSVGSGIGMGLVVGGRCTAGGTAWQARSPTCRCPAARAPIRRTPAAGARWRPRPRRRPWSGRPGGPACAARSPPAGCSRRRPRATSGPRPWWRRRPSWWPGCCAAIVTIVDPALIVLGGGIGQAPGFAAAVTRPSSGRSRRSCPRCGSARWAARRSCTAAWPRAPNWPGSS